MDALHDAREAGADMVKQWDATLDKRTRRSHARCDGEIREIDDRFGNGLMCPGDPEGPASEVVNCRCALLQRARWGLDDDELATLKERAAYFGLDKADSFEEFKERYFESVEHQMASGKGIAWPRHGTMLRRKQFIELRDYAAKSNITIDSFRNSDVDVESAKIMIDSFSKVMEHGGPIAEAFKDGIMFQLRGMRSDDFALVYKENLDAIHLSRDAMRSAERLKAEYGKLADSGHFVRGTDASSVVFHELGHIVMLKYGIEPNDIVYEVLGGTGASASIKIQDGLSSYAISNESLIEVVPEAFSAYYSGVANDLAEKIVKAVERRVL